MKKKIFTLLFAVATNVVTMFAWDYDYVLIGDLYYSLSNITHSAEVRYKSYSNDTYNEGWTITTANIPASVRYNSKTYSVTSIGERAFSGCSSLTSVTIPNSVTSIGKEAFTDCSSLTSVTIGNNVASIGEEAFFACSSLTSVTIPNSVTSIGDLAFAWCEGLTSVTIGNSVTDIGEATFYECSGMTSVTIGNNVTSIGKMAFYKCSGLTSVVIPNSVTSIGEEAFAWCEGLTSVTIPNSVTSIKEGAFFACSSLTSVTIPDGITSIDFWVFEGCSSLTSVTIGNNVTSIGKSAFYECSSLTFVTIPKSVKSIGEYAFEGCTGLTSVVIPNSVTSIGEEAFAWCEGLTSVTIEAKTPPTIGSYVFDNTNYCSIYVPCSAVSAYKKAWNEYADRLVADCVSYTITFVNWDGSNLQTSNVTEGEMPQYTSTTPTRPDDGENIYTFIGWTPEIVPATEDAIYTATYEAVPKTDGIDEAISDKAKNTKFIREGKLLIEKNGKTYNVIGAELK